MSVAPCAKPPETVSENHCPSFPSPRPKPSTPVPPVIHTLPRTFRTCTYYIHPSHQGFRIHRCNCYPCPFCQQSRNLDLQSQTCNVTRLQLIRLGKASAERAIDAYPFHLCHSLPFQSHLQQWNSGTAQYIDALQEAKKPVFILFSRPGAEVQSSPPPPLQAAGRKQASLRYGKLGKPQDRSAAPSPARAKRQPGNRTLTHVILILGHGSYCILMCYKLHICLSCSSSICSNINVNSYRVQW